VGYDGAGKTVTINPRHTDRYGRVLAEVMLPDGGSFNREQVCQMYARWYRRYEPIVRKSPNAQRTAKPRTAADSVR
jgi:endonuclease YncB( thermonuclease family)